MTPEFDGAEFLTCASRIGDMVCDAARIDSSGSIWWGRGFDLAQSPCEIAGMFNGRAGEAWYLSRLAAATHRERFAEVARDSFAPVVSLFEDSQRTVAYARRAGIGITGLGSLVFALEDAGDILNDDSLRSAALNVVSAPLESVLEGVDYAELYWGAPMLILALLRLQPSPRGDALLRHLVDGLLCNNRIDHVETQLQLWKPRFGPPQSGLAHGVTGVALALTRAGRYLNHTEALDQAQQAFSFERALYRPSINAWADTLSAPDTSTTSAWCHGAVGIGLSRLSQLDIVSAVHASSLVSDAEQIADVLARRRVSGPSNLCCGWLGQIEFLLEAADRLDPQYAEGAYALGGPIVTHILTKGYRSLSSDEHVADGPGLWQGLAGIGYTMLRLHNRKVNPSVLTFETSSAVR